MSDDNSIRHRFTVPANDTVVNEWIDNQSNLSFSLRLLISTCAKQMGTDDVTCQLLGMDRPLSPKGRPRKDAKEKLLNFNPNSAFAVSDDDTAIDAESFEEVSNNSVSREIPDAQQVQPTASVQKPVSPVDMSSFLSTGKKLPESHSTGVSQDLLDSL